MASNPEQNTTDLQPLTDRERHKILVEWNDTKADYPEDKCIHQLFETQVEKSPDAFAVIYEDDQLTYRELNERSNQLAHYLQKQGVGPDVLVGVCMERCLEMVIGILGILKAGGACVPMDPSYPTERLNFMIADAQVPIILTTKRLLNGIPHHWAKIVYLSDDEIIRDQAKENLSTKAYADNLVYVIYTSGSTGKPKGVALNHHTLSNLISWQLKNTALSEGVSTLQFASLNFDVSFQEIFTSLCSGGSLIMIPESIRQDIENVAIFIANKNIDRLFLPFVVLQQLAEVIQRGNLCYGLREVITAGEQLRITPAICELFSQLKTCSFYNQYGPSETHVVTSYALGDSPKDWPYLPPIGRPIDNTIVYITDSNLQPVPIGVTGELLIGGVGLGREYLNLPEMTREKFISNPFSKDPEDRLYKTGDLVRYLPDGNIEFLGRIDNQVKIRGFRIELGEIEAVLGQYFGVTQVVVLAREDEPGNKRLVAYIVPEEDSKPLTSELRDFLKKKLPDYMIPSVFIMLDSLPLTLNGKVDRKALPTPDQKRPELEREFVAPRTPIEKKLSEIWGRLLKLKEVGVNDNFFDLGGHSLIATQIVSRVADIFQVEIPIREVFESPTVAGLAERITATLQSDLNLQVPPLQPVPRREKMLLSFAQQRLWFLCQLERDSSFYNIPYSFRLTGSLNIPILHRSLNAIISRHEVLRTSFESEEGRPFQVIKPVLKLDLPVLDLTKLDECNRETELQRLSVEEAQKPFKLSKGPLIRAVLLRLDEHDHVLLLTMHHIISDGWSMGILNDELGALYTVFCRGSQPSLRGLPIQYGDFAHWQRQCLKGEVYEKQLSYWKKRLEGAPSLLELPTDRPRPTIQGYCGARESIFLSVELSESVQNLSHREGGTPFMTMLAAFQVLLYRYTGVEDILTGTPFANRKQSEIEDLIGFFVNTLVLRSDLSGNPSFREFMSQVRDTAFEAHAHQDLPFEKLVEAVQPERSLSYSPLFQVMFAFQSVHFGTLDLAGLTLTINEIDTRTSKFDLTLFIDETEQGLRALIEYNTDLFNQDTIRRMLGHFKTLLGSITNDPDSCISVLPILTQAEKDQLLLEWNDTKTDYPEDKCIHQLFEAQVEKTPDAVAVVYEDRQLTYRELNEKSNQLAAYLRKLGVEPEQLVGIFIERSIEMLIGILGILKAGGAYVPLDSSYPKERLEFILRDSHASVVITKEKRWFHLLLQNVDLICVDLQCEDISYESVKDFVPLIRPDNLAYIIYTSGSTGKPKGVSIEHRSVVSFISWVHTVFNKRELSGVLFSTSICFDLSIFELFAPLTSGGKAILVENAMSLPALQAASEVTLINTVPSAITELIRQNGIPSSVCTINLAGEPLFVSLVKKIYENTSVKKVYDIYGPSEDTAGSTWALRKSEGPYTIGRPIDNTQVYLLDSHKEPVPVGIPGEIYLGGNGLARNYLNRPELTVEKFVSNPFSEEPDARLYKTGDLARYLPDGNIEFLGRIDNQVKIRGYRIELGEIEVNLVMHPGVRQNVVLAREDEPGNKRLVAYIVPEGDSKPSTSVLRDFLKKKLPDYMIPSVFIMLDSLPLTPNGKVDRKALPAPDQTRPESEEKFVGPRDELDRQLVTAWERVLRISPISIRDNFFDLGGHSLLGVRLVYEIEKSTGKSIPLKAIFRFSTVEQMADTIKAEDASSPGPEVARKEHASPRLSPEQYKLMLTAIAGGKHQPVRPGSLMMHKNTNGFRRPLFWCFNSPETEMQNLAKYLGNSQPVYGLFSGAGVLKERGINDFKAIANYYINEIVALQPEGPYFIGGNCGGARAATEIAIGLRAQGKKVGRLCLLEFFDPLLFDYPGKMLLLYGEESHLKAYEPFRWHEPGWSKAFRVVPDVH